MDLFQCCNCGNFKTKDKCIGLPLEEGGPDVEVCEECYNKIRMLNERGFYTIEK